MRILFILKKHLTSGGGYGSDGRISSGLYTSAKFVSDMLDQKLGHQTKLVLVNDNNDIDKEVAAFQPDTVVIEALWVVPEKFIELHRLHPRVKWIVRNHSAMPFLAHEGIAMDWMLRYPLMPNVFIASNDIRTYREFQAMLCSGAANMVGKTFYLPNYYPTKLHLRMHTPGRILDVGCFGSLRPLKNQLIQAVAAIELSRSLSRPIKFHMNTGRVEGGESILKNIRSLFRLTRGSTLVEHPWLGRPEFLRVMRKMDVSMQVSFSETFNIVSADAVMNEVPVVVSSDIEWVHPDFYADPTSSIGIKRALLRALEARSHKNVRRLQTYAEAAIRDWAAHFPARPCSPVTL